jgi:hypothetical protein
MVSAAARRPQVRHDPVGNDMFVQLWHRLCTRYTPGKVCAGRGLRVSCSGVVMHAAGVLWHVAEQLGCDMSVTSLQSSPTFGCRRVRGGVERVCGVLDGLIALFSLPFWFAGALLIHFLLEAVIVMYTRAFMLYNGT